MVNSLGATPPEELYILYRVVQKRIVDLGATIVMPLVGRYATSMEMTGVSMTFCLLKSGKRSTIAGTCKLCFLAGGMMKVFVVTRSTAPVG